MSNKENTNESIVIWHPGTIESRPTLLTWASLFLYHDRVCTTRVLTPAKENEFLTRFCGLVDSGHSLHAIYELGNEYGIHFDWVLGWFREREDINARIMFNNQITELEKEGLCETLPVDPEKVARTGLSKSIIDNIHLPARFFFPDRKTLNQMITDMNEGHNSLLNSAKYGYPLVVDNSITQYLDKKNVSPDELSSHLAQSAISSLALPNINIRQIEDLCTLRENFKEELHDFRAGILDLTWLLHQQVTNCNDLDSIRNEANYLVKTKIASALMSLENKIKAHSKSTFKRVLFTTGKVIVEAAKLFRPGSLSEKLISGGASIVTLASNSENDKSPENQVASYIYKLKEYRR